MEYRLTEGSITKNLLKFAFPLMVGNLLQQLYNVADTLIVGRFLGADALAAVGSSYTLMVFLTSILLGLCMGSSAFFSMEFGRENYDRLKKGFFISFVLIGSVTILLNFIVFAQIDFIIELLQVPAEVVKLMRDYLLYIFAGIFATFLYNYFANLLRAVGNSCDTTGIFSLFISFKYCAGFGFCTCVSLGSQGSSDGYCHLAVCVGSRNYALL